MVAVAGNVFELRSFDADEETQPAADGDEHTLLKHCHTAMRRNGIQFRGIGMWSAACPRVTEDIKQRPFSEEEMEVARIAVRRNCFGLT
jgi:hypothetical protein